MTREEGGSWCCPSGKEMGLTFFLQIQCRGEPPPGGGAKAGASARRCHGWKTKTRRLETCHPWGWGSSAGPHPFLLLLQVDPCPLSPLKAPFPSCCLPCDPGGPSPALCWQHLAQGGWDCESLDLMGQGRGMQRMPPPAPSPAAATSPLPPTCFLPCWC